MIKIIKVTGDSLSPFFLPGDFVFTINNQVVCKNLRPGDTVVFTHNAYGRLIKTVLSNDIRSQTLQVKGSHPESISSAKLGPIPYRKLLGKVIFHIQSSEKSKDM